MSVDAGQVLCERNTVPDFISSESIPILLNRALSAC